MFQRLQKKWKVNGLQLALILCTFAIGGSLTGYAGRKLMVLFDIDQRWLWVLVYIIVVTILWPLAVLLVSFPFGQFRFFIQYLGKIGRRMGIAGGRKPEDTDATSGPTHRTPYIVHPTSYTTDPVSRIAIFASGAGSNAQRIIDHFRNAAGVKVALIVCNKPGAGVLSIAERENIPTLLIEKEPFFRGDSYLDTLKEQHIDFIVLAGFLWKIPPALIRDYRGRIINIHPALLPKYGGKGMYGEKVHAAVIAAGEKESGITIHYVDELYDHGEVILQATCQVLPGDTPATLAQKIHALEYQHYPVVIEQLLVK